MNPERIILEALSSAYPRMLREPVLHADLINAGHKLSLTELKLKLRTLENKAQLMILSSEDHTYLKITPDGLSRLAE